jgi:membrane protease YdiL (CAAX protease family)
MRADGSGDVWKLWLYAAASVLLGAWVSPLIFNAGKALAEVSRHKTTNDFLEWLAGYCAKADFPQFYQAGLLFAAVLLFFPWIEWHGSQRKEPGGLKARRAPLTEGQPLRKNLLASWQACGGFMVASAVLLTLGMALVPTGMAALKSPGHELGLLAIRVLPWSIGLAIVMEILFRGVAFGIFLRAMQPASAIAMSALFFSLVMAMNPPAEMNVADPEASGIGFELLGMVMARLADWRGLLETLVPLGLLGLMLAYARWRTASLWLPIGLHTGWRFGQELLARMTVGTTLAGKLLQQSAVPLVAILLTGAVVHLMTPSRDHAKPADS